MDHEAWEKLSEREAQAYCDGPHVSPVRAFVEGARWQRTARRPPTAPEAFYDACRYAALLLVVCPGFWSSVVRPSPLFDGLSAASAASVAFALFLSAQARSKK